MIRRPISMDMLRADCNIGHLQIQDMTILSRPGEHATVTINALSEPDKAGFAGNDLSGQPVSVRVKEPEDEILFYGVIYEAAARWKAGLLMIRIVARSLSWLLDLEKKRRSFQKTDCTHTELFSSILKEHGAFGVFNIDDRPIGKPYIQYDETDWAFMKRISSRLGVKVFPSAQAVHPKIYFGFPSNEVTAPMESDAYRFGMDDALVRTRGGDKKQCAYYEVEDNTPREVGDKALFRGTTWYVSEVSARLEKGALRFRHRLAGFEYNKTLPDYNSSLRGLSLTGVVLERKAEQIRIHLDIDEEQRVEDAYFYTWLPETGNIMYNMPPEGTRVSLYMQSADEHSAIGIRNVRENGAACAFTQDPAQRFLTTEPQKSLSIKPWTMALTAMRSGDCALLDDNFGCRFTSGKEILIQANGNIFVDSARVNMRAPQEVTVVRRDLSDPTVLNLCNNVDTAGGRGLFEATGKYYNPKNVKSGRLTSYEYRAGLAGKQTEQEKRKKLRFEMAELFMQFDEPRYDITDMFQNVLAAIPQRMGASQLAKLSAGCRVLVGSWKGAVPGNLANRTVQRPKGAG